MQKSVAGETGTTGGAFEDDGDQTEQLLALEQVAHWHEELGELWTIRWRAGDQRSNIFTISVNAHYFQ